TRHDEDDDAEHGSASSFETIRTRESATRERVEEAEDDRKEKRVEHLDRDAEPDEIDAGRDQHAGEDEATGEDGVEPWCLARMIGERAPVSGDFADAPRGRE